MLKLFISAKNDAHVVIFDYQSGVGTPNTPAKMWRVIIKTGVLQLPK